VGLTEGVLVSAHSLLQRNECQGEGGQAKGEWMKGRRGDAETRFAKTWLRVPPHPLISASPRPPAERTAYCLLLTAYCLLLRTKPPLPAYTHLDWFTFKTVS